MSTHQLEHLFAGDDWEINATLLDDTGDPYDLSGTPLIQWVLLNPQGSRVIDSSETTVTIVTAAQGKCLIKVAHGITTRLAGDIYTDYLRLTLGGIVSTLSTGQITVFADPWRVSAAVSSQRLGRSEFRRIVP